MKDLPELLVADAGAWRTWLDLHEGDPDGVWLRLTKKGFTEPTSLTYEAALLEALCSGWIDGQARRCDERSSWQRFTPRRPRSRWSERNVARVQQLMAEGRMRQRGANEVERAHADGRWEDAYAGPATIQPGQELVDALAGNARASAAFDTLGGSNRYAVIYRASTPRTVAGRQRAAARLVASLERGEWPHRPAPE